MLDLLWRHLQVISFVSTWSCMSFLESSALASEDTSLQRASIEDGRCKLKSQTLPDLASHQFHDSSSLAANWLQSDWTIFRSHLVLKSYCSQFLYWCSIHQFRVMKENVHYSLLYSNLFVAWLVIFSCFFFFFLFCSTIVYNQNYLCLHTRLCSWTDRF